MIKSTIVKVQARQFISGHVSMIEIRLPFPSTSLWLNRGRHSRLCMPKNPKNFERLQQRKQSVDSEAKTKQHCMVVRKHRKPVATDKPCRFKAYSYLEYSLLYFVNSYKTIFNTNSLCWISQVIEWYKPFKSTYD